MLRGEACRGLGGPPITEDQYRTNEALRDYVYALDAKWVAFGCEEGT